MKLSKTEEQLMGVIWDKEKIFMKDIIQEYPNPKPATTTIATLLKRIRDKKFIDYEQIGKSRLYYPLINKNDYVEKSLNGIIKNFFGNSTQQFASFFAKTSDLNKEELKALRKMIDAQIKRK